ncbi:MAG TPA: TPM domain-containing protein [Gammaproteobacteria bacterium]|nr:TPM domain-containing protein [Gammaproteobacteria bacterium]
MAFLSDTEKQRIAAAIAAAERNTRGELVTVITASSDAYHYIPFLWAALLSLLVPCIDFLLDNTLTWNIIYLIQICTFLGAAAVFNWTPLKTHLIPDAVKRLRAHRLAQEQFFMQKLHMTRERTGVLLFVSVAERYVEIIADQGINEVVPENAWQAIIEVFVQRVHHRQVADGFLGAITACGELLSSHFPAQEDDSNELPNHLIEL